jgi:hypothetical protein
LERRDRDRYRIWVAVEVATDGQPRRPAVTYDASDKGLLLLAPFELEVGASVQVSMHLAPGEPGEHLASGRVVRSGANEDDPEGLWPFRLAVAFDSEMPEIEGHLVVLSARHPLVERTPKG